MALVLKVHIEDKIKIGQDIEIILGATETGQLKLIITAPKRLYIDHQKGNWDTPKKDERWTGFK